MANYKVTFISGSTDVVEADSAAEAKEKASKEFGRVKRVEILDEDLEVDDDDADDDEEDADDNPDDEEDNPDDDEDDEKKKK